MSSLRNINRVLTGGVTIGASETNTALTNVFPISAQDSRTITVDIVYDDAVAATGITAKLQTTFDNGTNWIDSGTVAITGAVATTTVKTIDLDIAIAGDQALLPLRARGRVVISSGAGDSATIDEVWVSRRTEA